MILVLITGKEINESLPVPVFTFIFLHLLIYLGRTGSLLQPTGTPAAAGVVAGERERQLLGQSTGLERSSSGAAVSALQVVAQGLSSSKPRGS